MIHPQSQSQPSIITIMNNLRFEIGSVAPVAIWQEVAQVPLLTGSGKIDAAIGRSLALKGGFCSRARASIPVSQTYELTIVALFRALQHGGKTITYVADTPQGATIQVNLPFSFTAWGGTMFLDITTDQAGATLLQGTTKFYGQLLAWGRGHRELQAVMDVTRRFATGV